MNNALLKLHFRENAGSQVDALSDEKKAIWRWQDDGAPPSPLDDELEEA